MNSKKSKPHTHTRKSNVFFFPKANTSSSTHPLLLLLRPGYAIIAVKKYSFGYWYSAPPLKSVHICVHVCVLWGMHLTLLDLRDSTFYAKRRHFYVPIFMVKGFFMRTHVPHTPTHIHVYVYVLSDSSKYLQSKRKVNKYDQIMTFCTFQNHWLAWIILMLII